MNMPNDIIIMIYSLVGSKDLVNKWWEGSNLAFDSMSPREMYELNPQRVRSYLEWHCFG